MKENLNDLRAFLAVAQAGSFTQAAKTLGVSPSALSHSIRGIEARLKIKLFHRSTRSIATTDAGERLYRKLLPLFTDIDAEIAALGEVHGAPRGKVRLNGTRHVFQHALRDKISRFLRDYPDIELELVGETRFVDIVAERFDAGIRLGDDVAKDMIAVRISADLHMTTAAAPAWLTAHGTPQTPADLPREQCLRLLLPGGNTLAWEYSDPARPANIQKITPQGRLASNLGESLLAAALAGHGILWTTRDSIAAELESGALVEILAAYAITYPGYHLYYPNRQHQSRAFQLLVAALRA